MGGRWGSIWGVDLLSCAVLVRVQRLPKLDGHRLGSFISPLIEQMGIGVERHRNSGMAQLFFHFLRRSAGGMHQAGTSVAQILDRDDPVDSCGIESGPPNSLPEVGDPDVSPLLSCKHQSVGLPVDELLEVPRQEFFHRFRDDHRASLMGFWQPVMEPPPPPPRPTL
jgi:hypothetical protein